MSYANANDPVCTDTEGAVELIIESNARDLGGFSVRRVLPARARQMVGPFIFFDHVGPAEFPPGEGIQVRPHPHIGLATVTYLFEGEILHRDNLGYTQPIRPGAVNLMTAGRGIVHSERAGSDIDTTSRLHGIQSWMALPDDQQEVDPDFVHYPAGDLPEFERRGVTIRVIIGDAFGHRSPVATLAPMLYLECRMQAGSTITLPDHCDECAAYVVDGEIRVDEKAVGAGQMVVGSPGKKLRVEAIDDGRIMVIGGAHMSKRHIWWNFVAMSKERIEKAKEDWRENRYAGIPGDTEFIPLPE